MKMKQETFTDMEYSNRKHQTKREEFLEIMEHVIPWDEWVLIIKPHYPKGERGRPPKGSRVTIRILGMNHEANRIWGVITHMTNH